MAGLLSLLLIQETVMLETHSQTLEACNKHEQRVQNSSCPTCFIENTEIRLLDLLRNGQEGFEGFDREETALRWMQVG